MEGLPADDILVFVMFYFLFVCLFVCESTSKAKNGKAASRWLAFVFLFVCLFVCLLTYQQGQEWKGCQQVNTCVCLVFLFVCLFVCFLNRQQGQKWKSCQQVKKLHLFVCLFSFLFVCFLVFIFLDTYSQQKQVQKPGAKEEREEGVSKKKYFHFEFCKYIFVAGINQFKLKNISSHIFWKVSAEQRNQFWNMMQCWK